MLKYLPTEQEHQWRAFSLPLSPNREEGSGFAVRQNSGNGGDGRTCVRPGDRPRLRFRRETPTPNHSTSSKGD